MTKTIIPGEPVLNPYETGIVIDAILMDTEYLLDSDSDEVYRFTFAPATMYDHQRLFEHIEMCKMQVEMKSDPYSDKEPRFNGETASGFVRCTQMYAPKVSLEVEHWSQLHYMNASLNLNVNDDPTGCVYLNCAYCDPYEKTAVDSEDTLLEVSDIDDLF